MEIIIIDRLWLSISAILAAILDSEKATRVAPPGLNFIDTLRTIEKCKEMISRRPCKVF